MVPPLRRRLIRGYVLLLGGSVALFLLIRAIGERWFAGGLGFDLPADAAGAGSSVPHVLLGLATVIAAARIVGALFQRIGQPAVVGETVAGILLGPSALGYFAPELSRILLPPDAIGFFSLISQVGVIFFMFLVGVQLDSSHLRGQGDAAIAISHASIVVPFTLGAALSLALYSSYGVNGVPFTAFALFLGVAMSITAFPVLARILSERRLQRTPLGSLALTVAAADDVTAWFLLAFVVGVVRAKLDSVVWTVGLTAVYIAAMLLVVAPLVRRVLVSRSESADASRSTIAVAMVSLLLSALTSELIGIHAIFGAFLMGVIIPAGSSLARQLTARLEDITVIVFLPVFFAFTGLRTKIGLLESADQWLVCGAIVLVATVGKFGGTLIGSRLARVPWRQSVKLGVLMNTRGLMELIVLNVALDLGILSSLLFTMMVVMAVTTTFMTTPWLALLTAKDTKDTEEKEDGAGGSEDMQNMPGAARTNDSERTIETTAGRR
jgi:Kef-type K+ transport system membrane component KefB